MRVCLEKQSRNIELIALAQQGGLVKKSNHYAKRDCFFSKQNRANNGGKVRRKSANQDSWLLRFASKVFKYFLLRLFGWLVVILLSGILGFFPLITLLLSLLEHCLIKFAVVVLCLVGVAVVIESMR